MAGPVRQLMQRGAVVSSGVFESVFRRQMDAVLRAAVKGAIRLVVADLRAGVLQDLLARLDSLERRILLGLVRPERPRSAVALKTVYTRWMSRPFSASRLVVTRLASPLLFRALGGFLLPTPA